jgi:hypothetical protein
MFCQRICILIVCQIFVYSVHFYSAQAQQTQVAPSDAKSYKFKRGARFFSIEAGYSPFEPTNFNGKKEINTAGRKLGKIDLNFGRVYGTRRGVTYTYHWGITPFLIALKNEVKNPAFVSAAVMPNVAPTKRETSFAVGFSPANFQFIFLPRNRVKPFAELGAGVLFFNKPFPIPESRHLNFSGNFGGGLMIHKSKTRALILGYKYFHISNGNTTAKRYNVGFNANTFYLGYWLFR